jgi:hypothetical protein
MRAACSQGSTNSYPMPIRSAILPPPGAPSEAERLTRAVVRGVRRMFDAMGYGTLTEFRLPLGRRADVVALSEAGEIVICEVKSSRVDYRADRKWQDYVPYCEGFYFAVPVGFPIEILPEECGLIVADAYGAAVRRASPPLALNPVRKRRLLVRYGHAASARLFRLTDPEP